MVPPWSTLSARKSSATMVTPRKASMAETTTTSSPIGRSRRRYRRPAAHPVVCTVRRGGAGVAQAQGRDADAEEDGDGGVEQEGRAGPADAADDAGEQGPDGGAAHGGPLQPAGGAHQRDIAGQVRDGGGQAGLQHAVGHAEAEDQQDRGRQGMGQGEAAQRGRHHQAGDGEQATHRQAVEQEPRYRRQQDHGQAAGQQHHGHGPRRVGLLVHAQRQGDVGQAVPSRHHHLQRRGDPQGSSRGVVAWKCGSHSSVSRLAFGGSGGNVRATARVRALVVTAWARRERARRRMGSAGLSAAPRAHPAHWGAGTLTRRHSKQHGVKVHGGPQPDSRRHNSGQGGMARSGAARLSPARRGGPPAAAASGPSA